MRPPADLRGQGSEIAITDQVKELGRQAVQRLLDARPRRRAWIADKATATLRRQERGWRARHPPASAIAWLLAAVVVLAIVAGLGVLIWFVAHKVEVKRVVDYRAGKNT